MKKLPRKARSRTGKPDRVSAREDRRRRFASGALLFAKTGPDRDALVRQFLDHTPVRQYFSEVDVVEGRPACGEDTSVSA
jgi:hypothetical protein